MKSRDKIIKLIVYFVTATALFLSAFLFADEILNFGADLALLSLKMMLPVSEETAVEEFPLTENREEPEETTEKSEPVIKNVSFTETPKDIKELVKAAEKTASKDKKAGKSREKQYKNEGVTDK